eukprot:scaffold5412_cov171-Ochromonas_danica.AAC.3
MRHVYKNIVDPPPKQRVPSIQQCSNDDSLSNSRSCAKRALLERNVQKGPQSGAALIRRGAFELFNLKEKEERSTHNSNRGLLLNLQHSALEEDN